MELLLVILAYLIGSVNPALILARVKGVELTERGIAGTLVSFRHFGPYWGTLVLIVDVGKGALAAYLASLSSTAWLAPVMAAAVVMGHIAPIWFGFRGGGGVATTIGFLLYAYTQETLGLLVVMGLVIWLYRRVQGSRQEGAFGSVPAGLIAGLVFVLVLLIARGDMAGVWVVLAMGLALASRGVLALLGRW